MRQRRAVSARAIAGAASAAAPMAASTPRLRKESGARFTTRASRAAQLKRAIDDAPQRLRGRERVGPGEDRADDRDAVGTRRDHLRRIRLGDPGDRAEGQGRARPRARRPRDA